MYIYVYNMKHLQVPTFLISLNIVDQKNIDIIDTSFYEILTIE